MRNSVCHGQSTSTTHGVLRRSRWCQDHVDAFRLDQVKGGGLVFQTSSATEILCTNFVIVPRNILGAPVEL